jgi:hypothetical protein
MGVRPLLPITPGQTWPSRQHLTWLRLRADLRANQGLQVPHETVYRSLADADAAATVSVVTGFMPRFS